MKIRNYFTIALAALAMAACSENEIDGPAGPENGGFTPGEATYATFSFKLGDKNSFRSSSNAGGGAEDAVNKEDEIAFATIYLFEWEGNEAGRSDVMVRVTGSTAHGGAFDVPSKPVMTTAGKKHLVIVTNMSPTTEAKLNNAFGTKGKLTGYDEFYKAMMDVTANQATDPATEFVTGAAATTNVTMIGESDPIIEAGVSETEATTKNHISVFVDRAVAKLDLKLQGATAADYVASKDVMATTLGTTTAAKVGQISNVEYDVRNMNRKQYYLQHTKGADFVVTPESHQKPDYWTPWKDIDDQGTAFAAFYPSLTPGTPGTFTLKALTAEADAKGASYRNFVAYVTENTNETAAVGSSSYTAMKTTYNPIKANYVSGFTNAGASKVVTLTEVVGAAEIVGTGTVEVGGAFSLFNQEYNLAFKGEANKDDAKKLDYFRTMAAYHTSRIEPSLVDISADKIVFVKVGVLSGNNDAAVIDFGTAFKVDESITSTGNITAICAGLKILNQGPKLVVLVKETKNTAGDLELITLQAAYFWKPDANVDEYAHNGGVNFGTLTAGIYNVEDNGLTSYYRVNIFDVDRSATHQLRYSVIRNYSYHVNVTKVNKIGFPTDFDVTVDPETPLNNNTFLQAHVTINKWVKKQMDTELGQ